MTSGMDAGGREPEASLEQGLEVAMHGFVRVLSIAGLLGAVTLSTLGQEHRSSQDMVYSDAQAREGRTLYREACEACHAADEFVGPDYMMSWTGQSAADLFNVIRDTMPEEAAGSLSPDETAALVAHLFRLNGMPAGETALDSDAASLKEIRIEGPYTSR